MSERNNEIQNKLSKLNKFSYEYKSGPSASFKNKKKYTNRKRKFGDILKIFDNKLNNSDSESDNDDNSNGLMNLPVLTDDSVTTTDNKIYFKSPITETSINKLIKIIEDKNRKYNKFIEKNDKKVKFNDIEPKPIYLHITSYGGDLMSSFRAVDAIKRSTIPIYTVVDGYAASGATLMSIVGKKRYMTPSSYMLIHQLSTGTFGKFWEILDEYENCNTMMNDIYKLYVDNTKMELEEVEEHLSHDIWFKLDKCIEYGLVDEVYDNNV